jgi:hypothetical protein
MERYDPDVQPTDGPEAKLCAECDRVLVGRRADATWCSARCRMRWKRKQKSLQQARASYSAVHPDVDVSLSEMYEQAKGEWRDDPRNYSDFGEVPGDLGLDEDQDDVDEPGGWMPRAEEFERARERLRHKLDTDLQPYAYMIQRNFAGDAKLAGQRDPRVAKIVGPFLKEMELIDAAERKQQYAEAVEGASKPWAVARRLDRARGIQAAVDFGKDLGRPTRLTGPPPGPGRSTENMAVGFGQPSGIFGSDSDMFQRSQLARGISGTVYSGDGWRY